MFVDYGKKMEYQEKTTRIHAGGTFLLQSNNHPKSYIGYGLVRSGPRVRTVKFLTSVHIHSVEPCLSRFKHRPVDASQTQLFARQTEVSQVADALSHSRADDVGGVSQEDGTAGLAGGFAGRFSLIFSVYFNRGFELLTSANKRTHTGHCVLAISGKMCSSSNSIIQAQKLVDQLQIEAGMERFKISLTAADLVQYCQEHRRSDPLLTGISASSNPFKDKKTYIHSVIAGGHSNDSSLHTQLTLEGNATCPLSSSLTRSISSSECLATRCTSPAQKTISKIEAFTSDAPGSDEMLQLWSHFLRADEPESADRNGCRRENATKRFRSSVGLSRAQLSFGCVGSVYDLHQVREHHANIRLHLCTYREEKEQRRQLLHVATETLGKSTQQIQGHDHKIFVWSLVLVRMLVIHLDRQEKAYASHANTRVSRMKLRGAEEERKAAHLQAASCTLLLLSKMRFRSSVMRGLSYGSKHQDARLLDDPVGMEEQPFQKRQKVPVSQRVIIVIVIIIFDVFVLLSLPSFMLQGDGARLVEAGLDVLLAVRHRLVFLHVSLKNQDVPRQRQAAPS
ncbi:hypothetical protein CCH79_00014572 [Gambusia affinis]|uniref:Guanine nucleotide-binding protein subunit gamma n=1 Tax=Gambusia affinis TaxID=33528 RepID=A0A315V8Z0_GAMAF|nr:hypothetical protein CCH79_00014572 [Gambusia affinis]